MNEAELGQHARQVRNITEPIAASVYFSPEAMKGYEDLGLDYFQGYFCSRGACLGKAPWSVICAAFAAFNPAIVQSSVDAGWAVTEPQPLLAARLAGAEAQLQRLLGEPGPQVARATELLLNMVDGADRSGRMLFSGLSLLPQPTSPWGAMWHAADLVREHRGDGHIASWIPHLDSCEVTLLTELAWGLPPRSYSRTRGWADEDMDAGQERLQARGLLDGDQLTDAGRSLRASIERETDQTVRTVQERLGDDLDELVGIMSPWAKAVVAAKAYPVDPANQPDIRV